MNQHSLVGVDVVKARSISLIYLYSELEIRCSHGIRSDKIVESRCLSANQSSIPLPFELSLSTLNLAAE
jgi:hypothetical protein